MKTNNLLIKLLALLGFACAESRCDIDDAKMYGPPYADFEIKGTVSDENGDPITGIRVTVRPTAESGPSLGSGVSNAAGNYVLTGLDLHSNDIDVVAEDVDGPENGGEFKSETKNVQVNGDLTVNFTLTPKAAAERQIAGGENPEPKVSEDRNRESETTAKR